MEPRPYQAEAFDAARKANVVMIGATGVGKVRKQQVVYGLKILCLGYESSTRVARVWSPV